MDNQTDISNNKYGVISFAGNQSATDTTGGYRKVMIKDAAYQIHLFGFAFSEDKLIYQSGNRTFKATLLALICHNGNQTERELRMKIYKNGNPINDVFGKIISTGSSIFKAVPFNTDIDLADGDILEVMVSNATGTEKVIVKDLKLTITAK